jgi:hypothetical protein
MAGMVQYRDLHTVSIYQYVFGKNNHAYKIYKHLVIQPLSKLTSYDKEFITIINSMLYTPGSPGAIESTTDFKRLCV